VLVVGGGASGRKIYSGKNKKSTVVIPYMEVVGWWLC